MACYNQVVNVIIAIKSKGEIKKMQTLIFFDIRVFWGVCIFAFILLVSVIVLFIRINKYKDMHKKIIHAYNLYIKENKLEIPDDKIIKEYVVDIVLSEKKQDIKNKVDELRY